ncbi:hypothetical protein [Thiolapillus sp.]
MRTLIFSLLFAFSTLGMAEPLPQGHPSIQQALDASPSQNNGGKVLVNEGTVINAVPTKNYTYLKVQQEGEKIWLATQRQEVSEGALIRYGRGVVMKNFYSNTLKKEFPSILFVQAVEVVKK